MEVSREDAWSLEAVALEKHIRSSHAGFRRRKGPSEKRTGSILFLRNRTKSGFT